MTLPERQIFEAARFLAAKGRYDVAAALLDTVSDEALQVDTLLLRGKIHAQTGRYEEAIKVWDKILAKSPDNREAADAIRKARQMQKSRFASHPSRIRVVAAAGAVLCLLILLTGSFALGRRMTRGDQGRLQELVRMVQADINRVSDNAVAKALTSQTDQNRQTLLTAIDTLQGSVQSLLEQQTTSLAGHLDVVVNGISTTLGDTQNGLRTLRQDIAKEQTAVRVDANNRRTEWTQRIQGILAQMQVIQALQTQIAEARAADKQVMTSVLQLVQSLQQGLSTTLSQVGQIMEAQAAEGRRTTALSNSIELLRDELARIKEQVAEERVRSDQTLHITVEALRPANMDHLNQRIKETQETLVALKAEEDRLRGKNCVVIALRRPTLLRKIREAEGRLKAVQDQWTAEVLPWMEAKQALDHDGSWTEQ